MALETRYQNKGLTCQKVVDFRGCILSENMDHMVTSLLIY